MALEQSINADSKTKGGIIGISQSPSAVDRWFLTIHERASVTTAIKKVYGMKDNDNKMHKEATKARVKQDEDDINKLLSCFTSGLTINPFSLESDALVKFATGVVLPDDVAETLVNSTKKGQNQMNNFIEERINSNTTSFWDSIPNIKVKTFSSVSTKVSVKATDEKLMTVNADRDLFGRLLVAANARQINLKEVLRYELSPVPCSLAHQGGSLRKTTKSTFCSILEKNVTVLPRLPVSTSDTVYIIDRMALVQKMKSGGARTFGELSLKYYSVTTLPLSYLNCHEVHVVFDQYWENSIKNNERSRRGASTALEVKISSSATPIPKQWDKYISNCKNKTNV